MLDKDEKINAVFVNQAYKTFLRRPPSEEELSERLALNLTKSELFQELWNSAELKTIIDESEGKNNDLLVTRDEIIKAYFIFLGRSPSEDELNERTISCVSKTELLVELWDSEELRHRLKNEVRKTSVAQEDVYTAYEVFFHRTPTEEELAQRTTSGIYKEELLEELWNSEEMACLLSGITERKSASREEIWKAYEVFFRRTPTKEELDKRVISGICKEELLEELWNSEEMACLLSGITERKSASREEIRKAYEVFFRRTPTKEELDKRVISGICKEELLEELWNSEELIFAMDRVSLKSNEILERTDVDQKIKEVLKKTLEKKWKLEDFIDRNQSIGNLSCNICSYEGQKKDFEILDAECAFGGGHLERYKCPKCGCIFGPIKMLKLTPEELEEEYKIHYSIYNEGDCTEKELMTFFSLKPDKEKRYLNFGCGIWADTIGILREKGFDVWGYEPFSAETLTPYVIRDFSKLNSMKFDGIFSNDLLEHLANPTEYFLSFKKLLKNGESKMAHSTGCYKYLYETTRFHLFFFTGKSAEILAQNTGFEVDSYQEDKNIDYYNYVYKLKER